MPPRPTGRNRLSAGGAPTKRSRPAQENSRIQSFFSLHLLIENPDTHRSPSTVVTLLRTQEPWHSNMMRYKGVTKTLVVSELIAIFHARHRKS